MENLGENGKHSSEPRIRPQAELGLSVKRHDDLHWPLYFNVRNAREYDCERPKHARC